MRVLVVNPGSTSTKTALFEDERAVFSATVRHPDSELSRFPTIPDQLDYRESCIIREIDGAGIPLRDVDAVVGRGGGLLPTPAGVYEIDELMLDHSIRGVNGIAHPAQLGATLAYRLAKAVGALAFMVDPPETDELQDTARYTGLRGVYRHVHLHALNLKETARRHAERVGKKYEDLNLVVCHLGGGISVSAHRRGRMIDGNDIVGGEGPLAPTRCGSVPVVELVQYLRSGNTYEDVMRHCTQNGGFMSHFGTSSAIEVRKLAENGSLRARAVWDTMVYQIVKFIGAMAAALGGHVDGILLGGGMVFDSALVEEITEGCGWIAPVTAYPGEFEMEALAAGALRAMRGQERVRRYTGEPVWSPAPDIMEDEGWKNS